MNTNFALTRVGTYLNLENLTLAHETLLELCEPAIHQIASSGIDGAIEGLSDFDPDGPLDLKRRLQIAHLAPHQYPTMAKIMKAWVVIANAKTNKVQQEDQGEDYYWQLSDSCVATHSILDKLENPDFDSKKIFVCRDENGQYHGIVIVADDPRSTYVSDLATNPINIRGPINDLENDRVSGAGTLLMNCIENRAIKLGHRYVHLLPLPSARPYYEGRGYVGESQSMEKWFSVNDDDELSDT